MPKRYGPQRAEHTGDLGIPNGQPTRDTPSEVVEEAQREPSDLEARRTARKNAEILQPDPPGEKHRNAYGPEDEARNYFDILTVFIPQRLENIREQLVIVESMAIGARERRRLVANLLLTASAEAIYHLETNARNIATSEIRAGNISRVQAAELLGVHQGTVGKWVKEDEKRPKPQY